MRGHQPKQVVRPAETDYYVAECSCGWKLGYFDKGQALAALREHAVVENAALAQSKESE